MDAVSALILVIIPFLVGAGMLLCVWWCWSGRYRRWATRMYGDMLVLCVLPSQGVILIAFAFKVAGRDPVADFLLWVGVAVCFLGLVALGLEVFGVHPRWWGPRWYHDLQASNPQPDLGGRLTAAWTSGTVPAPFSSDRNAAQAFGEAPVACWRVNYIYDPDHGQRAHGLSPPGGVAGHLTLYASGLTFAATGAEDSLRDRSTVMVRTAADVIGARVVPAHAGADGVVRKGWYRRSLLPRLVVDTRSGPLLFEMAGARRRAARINQTLGRR
jgi:hypothetical protein